MSKATTKTLRACTGVQRPPSTRRQRRCRPARCSAALALLHGPLVRRAPRLTPRIGGARRLRTANGLRPRVYARGLRLQSSTGLAPRRGGGLGVASLSWRGWTPCLPDFSCLLAMPSAWLQRSAAVGTLPRGRPVELRSRAPALRASAGCRACARQPGLGRAAARLLRDVRLAGWCRPDSLLAPSKRVPASKPSRGGGLRPPLHDRRPGGRLALGDGLRPAGASFVAPPARNRPTWGWARLRGLRSTDALHPDLAPLRNTGALRRFAARRLRRLMRARLPRCSDGCVHLAAITGSLLRVSACTAINSKFKLPPPAAKE